MTEVNDRWHLHLANIYINKNTDLFEYPAMPGTRRSAISYRDCAGDVIAWMAVILPGKITSNDADIASEIYVAQFDSGAMLHQTSLLRSNARVVHHAARCCRAKSDVTEELCTISIPGSAGYTNGLRPAVKVGTCGFGCAPGEFKDPRSSWRQVVMVAPLVKVKICGESGDLCHGGAPGEG